MINSWDQLQQTLSNNARVSFVLLSFCDEDWGFGIKASYFFRAFSGKKLVTVSQQEWLDLNELGYPQLLIDRPHCIILRKK